MNPARDGMALFAQARRDFHDSLLASVLHVSKAGAPSNADKHNRASVAIAHGIIQRLGTSEVHRRKAGQTSGNRFEICCRDFLSATFLQLAHLRPGLWTVKTVGNNCRLELAKYEQYRHLIALHDAAMKDPELAAVLGSDYTITPDILVSRDPESDERINAVRSLVDDDVARRTSIRKRNNPLPILHASISCKWTIRSDRSQNSRAEALNLIRNRKGRLPHVAVIVAEPTPSRIASISLGTGDIDCVYHFALPELMATLDELDFPDAKDMLATMVDGKRLRDIADLPLDLAV